MKALIAASIFTLAASVSYSQETQAPVSVKKAKVITVESRRSSPTPAAVKPIVHNVSGIVRTASCGTYIEVNVNDEIHRYFPIGLNPKMHIEGYSILFDYADDPTSYPENCDITKSVRVNNVRYNGNN